MPELYKSKWVDGRKVPEHRWLMEQHLGRKLLHKEHVHHKNGNKRDNTLTNLEVLSDRDHAHLHLQKYPLTKTCECCGTEFTPHKTKRARAKTCSPACRWIQMGKHRRVLDEATRQAIRDRQAATPCSVAQLAREYGVARSTIDGVLAEVPMVRRLVEDLIAATGLAEMAS